jgi:hypothetical protein
VEGERNVYIYEACLAVRDRYRCTGPSRSLALSIPHMLTHTTHVASPTFTYPPTNSKMVTDNSIGLLHGDPKVAQVLLTTVLPPPLDYQSSNIIPKQTKRKLLHSLFLIPFYAKTHNYQTTKIYGEALSADGSSLFVISNGNIVNGPRIPSMLDIHIPASER